MRYKYSIDVQGLFTSTEQLIAFIETFTLFCINVQVFAKILYAIRSPKTSHLKIFSPGWDSKPLPTRNALTDNTAELFFLFRVPLCTLFDVTDSISKTS